MRVTLNRPIRTAVAVASALCISALSVAANASAATAQAAGAIARPLTSGWYGPFYVTSTSVGPGGGGGTVCQANWSSELQTPTCYTALTTNGSTLYNISPYNASSGGATASSPQAYSSNNSYSIQVQWTNSSGGTSWTSIPC